MAIKGQYNIDEISDEGRFLKASSDEIIVRSAQNGILYLDVYHWERLSETKVSLSIYTNSTITIFNTQEDLLAYTKPQNKYGIVRMPYEYDLNDYNSLDSISEKGDWHFVFIVNENTKAAKSYKEVMNLDEYNF
jgi:outer membrane receptor for ferric coprogen and ferric-rhodotorulic acid